MGKNWPKYLKILKKKNPKKSQNLRKMAENLKKEEKKSLKILGSLEIVDDS